MSRSVRRTAGSSSQRGLRGGSFRTASKQRSGVAFGLVWCASVSLLLSSGCHSLQKRPVAGNVLSSRQIAMRGIDATQRGRWEEAESSFRSAIEMCPDYDRAHAGYAEALWQRGAKDLAITHQQRAVQLSGDDPELITRLGRMHHERGESAAAEHRVEQALREIGRAHV